jgi:8-oxo-dGTP diphosphatase
VSGPAPIKGPILVAAVVIERDAVGIDRGIAGGIQGDSHDVEILVAKRPEHHKIAGGQWEFPGGKVEAGEEPVQAAIREIREELGVEIEISKCLGVFSHVYETQMEAAVHIVLVVYQARLKERASAEFVLNDTAEVRWVSKKERPALEFAAADFGIVDLVWPR